MKRRFKNVQQIGRKYSMGFLILLILTFFFACSHNGDLFKNENGSLNKATVKLISENDQIYLPGIEANTSNTTQDPGPEGDSIIETGSPKNWLMNPNGSQGAHGWRIIRESGQRGGRYSILFYRISRFEWKKNAYI